MRRPADNRVSARLIAESAAAPHTALVGVRIAGKLVAAMSESSGRLGRMAAIVDVYDALTNDRPYRPAWTSAQAFEYIRAQSGKHFDPAIVETFLNMLARKN